MSRDGLRQVLTAAMFVNAACWVAWEGMVALLEAGWLG